MKHTTRRAIEADLETIAQIYDESILYMEQHLPYPTWKKGVYPTMDVAKIALKENTLYVACVGDTIAGSVILNNQQPSQYEQAHFRLPAENPLVVHTLVVSPRFLKQGIAQQLLALAENVAIEGHCQSIRLDTYTKNTPAIALYEKIGYQFAGLVDLELGMPFLFRCYEKSVENISKGRNI